MEILSILANLATAIGVVVAVIALYTQSQQNSRALAATLLRDLERQFESEEMLKIRLETARFLVRRKTGETPVSYCADLLDFFDVLGTYHNRRALDTEMTWVMFFYWFGHYWYLLREDAKYYEQLAGGVGYYDDAELLYSHLARFSRKKRNFPQDETTYFTKERIATFLEEEISQCAGRIGNAPKNQKVKTVVK